MIIRRHGRDNKIYVWQLRVGQDEAQFSTLLPIEDLTTERKQPWLLYSLDVNALNFCSFAMCADDDASSNGTSKTDSNSSFSSERVLIATPGLEDGHVNITRLPECSRFATIPTPKGTNTGMVMALGLCSRVSTPISSSPPSKNLFVAVGYESGHAGLWQQSSTPATTNTGSHQQATFQLIYIHHSHTQPVLSLCLDPAQETLYTSSADALIVRHGFAAAKASSSTSSSSQRAQVETESLQTRHAGQQSLAMRSDGKVFATAGWDGRARVYTAVKSPVADAGVGSGAEMREVAVLKWHQEGCYAVGFAPVRSQEKADTGSIALVSQQNESDGKMLTVAERRDAAARNAHWLAVGSKDGKVSLWDIF
jgi:WD40 repeat protein